MKPSFATANRGVVDLSRSAVPRYLQLATLFRSRIASGAWRSGDQIPTVEELAAECAVARATIRQALGQLEDEGLIERFRAKGTFVRAQPQNRLWCEVQTDWSGLLRSREGAEIEILGSQAGAMPPVMPAGLGLPAPSYRHIRRRHWRDGQPFLLADVYLDERLWPKVKAHELRTRTALNLVASLPGVTIADARQTLTIGSADVEVAEQLKMSLNAPIAHVRRVAVEQDGRVILVADGVYRGDIVRIDIKLSTAAAGE